MTQAVIFDMDGTLTDTEELWDEVRRGLAEADGVPWPASASTAMMGMSTHQWSAYLAEHVLGGSPQRAAERTIEELRERYRVELPAIPGAADAVRRMAQRWPLGVASSSPRVLIEQALTSLGVRELFQVVRSSEEPPGIGKPAPDVYLLVAQELGVQPERTVVVEDSGNGILAGLNAGMPVVAVPTTFHPPAAELLARVSAVLGSLDELTVELVERLGS